MISIWWNIFVLFSPSFCFHHRLSWLDLCFLPVYAHLKKCARSMVEKHRNSHVQGYARQNDLSYHESINISGSFLFCFFHACRVGTLQPIPACIGKKASHCYKHNKCDAILLKTNSLEAYGSKTFCSKVEKMWRILFYFFGTCITDIKLSHCSQSHSHFWTCCLFVSCCLERFLPRHYCETNICLYLSSPFDRNTPKTLPQLVVRCLAIQSLIWKHYTAVFSL